MLNFSRAFIIIAVVAVWGSLATSTVAAKPLEDAKWIEVTTPNFTVTSAMGKKKTVDMVRHLELLRMAFLVLSNTKTAEGPIPTRIYAVGRNASEFLGLMGGIAGSYSSGLRHNTILVRDHRWVDESNIVMHEYVHFLLRNNSGV